MAHTNDPRIPAHIRRDVEAAHGPDHDPRLARRAKRLASKPRPTRDGEAWDQWAEELLFLLHHRAYEHLRPHVTRPQFLYACGVTERTATRYHDALRVLEAAVAAGFNRAVLRRVSYTALARASHFVNHPDDLARHLKATLRIPEPPDAAPSLESTRSVHVSKWFKAQP
ncbi:hypothetical protein DM785_02600 [Deinococcus actinosclerus]|nr:hypothetical protein DM785_02600 [Deinococcus actinosclerus]